MKTLGHAIQQNPHITQWDEKNRILQSDVRNLSAYVHRAHGQGRPESLNPLFSSLFQEAWLIQVKGCVAGCVHTRTSCAPLRFLMSLEKCLRNPTDWLSNLYPQMIEELGSPKSIVSSIPLHTRYAGPKGNFTILRRQYLFTCF